MKKRIIKNWLAGAALFAAMHSGLLYAVRLNDEQRLSISKLRTYCSACHAVGELRFIYSDDDEVLWNDIQERVAPNSKKIWAKAILEVLNWPSEQPPDFDDMLDPPDKDWMPKGAKRLHMARDQVAGKSVRKLIFETIAKLGERRAN